VAYGSSRTGMARAQHGQEPRRAGVDADRRRLEDPVALNPGVWIRRVSVCTHARGGLQQAAELRRAQRRRRSRGDPGDVLAGIIGCLELRRAHVDACRDGIPEHRVTRARARLAGEVKARHSMAAHALREGVHLLDGDLPRTAAGPRRVRAATARRCQHSRPGENGHDHQSLQASPAMAATASACLHIIAFVLRAQSELMVAALMAAAPAGNRLAPARPAGPGWLR
jgi:hypothetical protein